MANKKEFPVPTFDIGNLEAKYKKPELRYVLLDELNIAEELRITAELILSFGLTLLGYSMSSGKYLYLSIFVILLAIIFFIRYYLKRNRLCKF